MESIRPAKVHEVSRKGQQIFESLPEELQKGHLGEAVAIEVESEEYFLGRNGLDAVHKAREKYPRRLFFVGRLGYPAYVSFRSGRMQSL